MVLSGIVRPREVLKSGVSLFKPPSKGCQELGWRSLGFLSNQGALPMPQLWYKPLRKWAGQSSRWRQRGCGKVALSEPVELAVLGASTSY